jgi:exodeoxyribonuclease-3
LSLRAEKWDAEFLKYLKSLEKVKPVVVCGDFNAAHEEIDIARPASNHHSAGFTDEERQGITNLISAGFVDTFRVLHPEAVRYTWWSHWGQARANNVGWRIDYFFVSSSLLPRIVEAEIYEGILGSDHYPVSITLDDHIV